MHSALKETGLAESAPPTAPIGLRLLAIALRVLFIGALVAITVRVSGPQSEKLSSIHETPEDLVRVALGFAACLWIVLHLFRIPRTPEGYRRSLYLGLVIAPIACVVAVLVWR
jgi:TRAP-type C4-dicarboxylate transport system permease small subunit